MIRMIGECPGCDGNDEELSYSNGKSWRTVTLQWGKLGKVLPATVKMGNVPLFQSFSISV